MHKHEGGPREGHRATELFSEAGKQMITLSSENYLYAI